MKEERTILKAEFNPKVCTYWLLNGIILLTVILVGIPLLLLWIPFGLLFTRRYLSRMSCELTEKNLKVNKGMFVRVEKTIPLEKITDLGMVQGPIMRRFGLHTLSVETAGQSMAGPLVSLTGIVDVMDFREAVLQQRDKFRESPGATSEKASVGTSTTADAATLSEINSTLLRIEELLKKSS